MVYLKHILVVLMFFPFTVKSQDTTFIKSIELPFYADNVTTNGEILFIKSGDSIYSLQNSILEFVSEAKLNYSWYNSTQKNPGFIHSEYIPKSTSVNKHIEHLVPGKYNGNITSASVGDKLYISYNGKVLQYKIASKLNCYLKGVSVRHIYSEPQGVQVFSTYNGVFVFPKPTKISDKVFTNPIVRYSSGTFTKIKDRYFLCQDNLIEYDFESRSMKRRIIADHPFRFRQLFEFNDNVYSVMTKGVSQVNIESFEIEQYFLQNKEITSHKVLDSIVVFSSRENGIYILDASSNLSRLNAPKKINDLIEYKNNLLLCTDDGLYKLNLRTGKYKKLSDEKYLHTIVKYNDGVIYSGNRGLYWFNGSISEVIIQNEEFNKLALLMTNGNLFAGSINGLYVIKTSDLQFLTNELSTSIVAKKNTQEYDESNLNWIILFIVFLLSSAFGYIFFLKKVKKQRQKQLLKTTHKEITVESVKQAIFQNESIKSVDDIARFFNTSVSQVNRKLKLENTSPLKCMKDTKREIIIEMHGNGKSIEEMTKRVGYSKRYIRENFLKNK